MDSGIQFGEFQRPQPQRGVAPDRDSRYAVAWVGDWESAVAIYVDLDVMRELESHARENLTVELGGVLLGEQRIDSEGRPFVVVRDSLRAEHYEATRGSFKFTHQTWEAISREREKLGPNGQMVGWYHTHPGWGVFLSDMDQFICDHFFNSELDLALVIDPMRDERGWFVWAGEESKSTVLSGGFALFAHRQRAEEVGAVAEYYNERETMAGDPRMRATRSSMSSFSGSAMERGIPSGLMVALLAVIFGQLVLMTAIMWQGFANQATSQSAVSSSPPLEHLSAARLQAYREILALLADPKSGDGTLVDALADAKQEVAGLRLNVEGQTALVQQLKDTASENTKQLSQVAAARDDLAQRLEDQIAQTDQWRTKAEQNASALPTAIGNTSMSWLIGLGIAAVLLAAAAAGAAGFYWGWRQATASTEAGQGNE